MLVILLGQVTRTTMEISNIPIAFCVILGNLIIIIKLPRITQKAIGILLISIVVLVTCPNKMTSI